mgnify:FL=1
MMDMRTNSSNNTAYADADGNVAYSHGNFISKNDPSFDSSQPVIGFIKKTVWDDLHTVDDIISILNPANGRIQNTNSTPFIAAGEFSPNTENYPSYIALDPENFTGIHAVQAYTGQPDLSGNHVLSLKVKNEE